MLLITQAKPNPRGKDRSKKALFPLQLAAEWFDIKNIGSSGIILNTLKLQHIAYNGDKSYWKDLYLFPINLARIVPTQVSPEKIFRIHSGSTISIDSLADVDRVGADYHYFTGQPYILNNNEGDSIRIYQESSNTTVDIAMYTANPEEGKILQRVDNWLI